MQKLTRQKIQKIIREVLTESPWDSHKVGDSSDDISWEKWDEEDARAMHETLELLDRMDALFDHMEGLWDEDHPTAFSELSGYVEWSRHVRNWLED